MHTCYNRRRAQSAFALGMAVIHLFRRQTGWFFGYMRATDDDDAFERGENLCARRRRLAAY